MLALKARKLMNLRKAVHFTRPPHKRGDLEGARLERRLAKPA